MFRVTSAGSLKAAAQKEDAIPVHIEEWDSDEEMTYPTDPPGTLYKVRRTLLTSDYIKNGGVIQITQLPMGTYVNGSGWGIEPETIQGMIRFIETEYKVRITVEHESD